MKNYYIFNLRVLVLLLFMPLHFTYGQSWQWAKSGGSFSEISGDEKVESMVTDDLGNIYILASVGLSSLKVDGINRQGIGARDYVIASFNCSGQYRWSRIIGSGHDDDMQRLQIDNQGNIYAVGKLSRSSQVFFRGETTDDIMLPYSLTQNKSLFLVKYNSAGALQWLKMPQPEDVTQASNFVDNFSIDLQTDPQGNSYWLCKIPPGSYANGAFVNTQAGNNFFIFKYNAAGQFMSAHPFDMYMPDMIAYELTLARNHTTGTYYIGGTNVFDYSMSVGGELITNQMFVAAFNANGTLLWKKLSNTSSFGYLNDVVNGLVIDKDNSIYITGGAKNGDSFAGATYTSSKPHQFPFLIKLSAEGQLIWSTNAETGGSARSEAITINGGEVAVTFGYTTLQWGNQSLAQVGNELSDVVLVRFNKATGQLIELTDIEGNFGYWDNGTALAADVYGNYVVGGSFGNFLYLPSQTLVNGAAGSDFFIAKYGTANCNCILLEPDFVYSAGDTGGDFTFDYTGTDYESISWDFGNGVTASGENPQHTFTQSGNHNVCVTITSSCGSEQYCLQVNAALGTDSIEMTVQMYPNPVKDKLTINVSEELSYQIFSILGSCLKAGTLPAGQSQVSFEGLPSGWYLFTVNGESGRQKTVKLFKE